MWRIWALSMLTAWAATAEPTAAGGLDPAVVLAAADDPADDDGRPAVECPADASSAKRCRVSEPVFSGWRTYHATCVHCHGQDGLGGSFANNLVATVRATGRTDFVNTVLDGYDGRLGRMPGYRGNASVEPKIGDVYEYLMRRASGELPPGRPTKRASGE